MTYASEKETYKFIESKKCMLHPGKHNVKLSDVSADYRRKMNPAYIL